MKTSELHIRDPFVLPVRETGDYYMFGSTNHIGQNDLPGAGFDCFKSRDLEHWSDPIPAFRPEGSFWGTMNHWAAEAYAHNGRYYMFATFKGPGRQRGTQALVSAHPHGPYRPFTDGPLTPANWECLDGTLHVDVDGNPWIVFCHEWTQVHDGGMWAAKLTRDLTRPIGRPTFLFNASEAPWVKPCSWPGIELRSFRCYITDGPFLFNTRGDALLMLWSSIGPEGYAIGLARSSSNRVEGPWTQDDTPIWTKNGGHGMIFKSHDGRLLMSLHQPNSGPRERAIFVEVDDAGDSLRIID